MWSNKRKKNESTDFFLSLAGFWGMCGAGQGGSPGRHESACSNLGCMVGSQGTWQLRSLLTYQHHITVTCAVYFSQGGRFRVEARLGHSLVGSPLWASVSPAVAGSALTDSGIGHDET